MQQFLKQTNEIKTFSVDFTPVLVAGETINGSNLSATAYVYSTGLTASGIIVPGSASLVGNIISFRAQNGTNYEYYKLTVSTGLTSAANKHEEDIILLVGDDTELLYTVDELKTSLGITDTASDALLFGIIKGASDYVKNAIGRNLFYRTYTETFYPEERLDFLMLKEQPLESVTSITIDGFDFPDTDGGYKNWTFDTAGIIKRIDGGTFPCGNIPVVVEYKAGYYAIPEDIRTAVKTIAISEYGRREKQGVLAETIGNYRIVYNTDSIVGNSGNSGNLVSAVINRYTRRMF